MGSRGNPSPRPNPNPNPNPNPDPDPNPTLTQVAGGTGAAAGKAQERELLLEGLRYATAALEADDTHFAPHKWYAILVSLTSGFEGTKATIHKSFVVKVS